MSKAHSLSHLRPQAPHLGRTQGPLRTVQTGLRCPSRQGFPQGFQGSRLGQNVPAGFTPSDFRVGQKTLAGFTA